ncbi:MAG: retropepsin-like aspartic protease, partial [Planctomycetota bacterium]
AAGVGARNAGAGLGFNPRNLRGQTSVSLLTLPAESPLPNVLGAPFTSQFATAIYNDRPQVFQHDGRTVRTPDVEFLPLGSGGGGITRRAEITLTPPEAFATAPVYIPDFTVILDGGEPHQNPTAHTLLSGGSVSAGAMFLSVDIEDEGERLERFDFFFDTGADVTVVSELNAARLGFDVVLDEPEFSVAVIGSGGLVGDVPGFFVDEFEVETVGGPLVVRDLPVIVLNVTNAGAPGNIVDGIVGTNVFAGRNLVIDPAPSLGGGGAGPQLYISDPVTTDRDWSAATPTGAWDAGGSWSPTGAPDLLSVARVHHSAGGDQSAVVSAYAEAWSVSIQGGALGEQMTLDIAGGVQLTTFSGVDLLDGGVLSLGPGAVLDTQFVEMRGGVLRGDGVISTGNGEIPGQVENNGGVVAPGVGVGTLEIVGRFSAAATGTLAIEIGGLLAGAEHDQLRVDGGVALGGTLEVSLVDLGAGLFAPVAGDQFTILTASEGLGGEFASLDLPADFAWDVLYNATSVELVVLGPAGLPGDFNADGRVDGADYAAWRNAPQLYAADALQTWRANFGATRDTPAAASAPEPAAACLLAAPIALLAACRRPRGAAIRRSGRLL